MYKSKKILITGGTGSFGNAVLRRLLKAGVKEVRIFSRDEKKQEDMRVDFNDERLKFIIGDVRDLDSISKAMVGVDFAFHAAALKQVPSCEFYPLEAVRTNILGTENVISAAIANNLEKLVVLSTDKAVYPINAMGISKAMAEKLVVARSRMSDDAKTVICCTRYGNVMASRGSVIPLFIKQIKENLDLTITDSTMTRFLMSLDESVDLVLYAFDNANQGDIFVQKAPACTVGDLAAALIEIFESNSNIQIIGTRHGEKLYESLISREEMLRSEDMGNYFRIASDDRDLNYKKYFVEGQTEISTMEDYTSHNTERLDIDGVKNKLLSLEYIKREINV
jgi:UDP-N-acetylglucosamine 4,6-dehydratase